MRIRLLLLGFFQSLHFLLLAQAGSLDASFSTDGKVQTPLGISSDAGPVAIQPADQMIVVAASYRPNSSSNGTFAVLRYTTAGSLDNGFGSGGVTTINLEPNGATPWAIAVQPDGKILVAGTSYSQFSPVIPTLVLVRLTKQGLIDPMFNGGIIELAGYTGSAMTLQSNGSILVAGQYPVPGSTTGKSELGIVCYTPNGVLDTRWGSGGKLLTDAGGSLNIASGIAVTPGGKVVVTGFRDYTSVVCAQYSSTGVLDNGFGAGGLVEFGVGSQDRLQTTGMTLQADGKILISGTFLSNNSKPEFLVCRLGITGTLDNTFAGNGKQAVVFLKSSYGGGIVCQPDGKIVVAGYSQPSDVSQGQWAICRLDKLGNLDNTFGSGGEVLANWPGSDDVASGVALQADGRIVVGGFAGNDQTNTGQMGVMRFLGKSVGQSAITAATDSVLSKPGFSSDIVAGIKLYPNPATSQLRVTGLPTDGPVLLTVTDLAGNTVLQQRSGDGSVLLDISRLAPASYVLTIAGKTTRRSLPFVKAAR
ncbi:MAG TPA: T9SS type A sorting domain-containing protein [Puia sp.]